MRLLWAACSGLRLQGACARGQPAASPHRLLHPREAGRAVERREGAGKAVVQQVGVDDLVGDEGGDGDAGGGGGGWGVG
jgi:hypothetical protein